MAYYHSVTQRRMFTYPEDVKGIESIAENEANFYTSESQAQQKVPVLVWAWTYTPIKKGMGKIVFSRI